MDTPTYCGINSNVKALICNYLPNGKQFIQIDDINQLGINIYWCPTVFKWGGGGYRLLYS